MISEFHHLPDGTSVRIRSISADDKARLAAGHAELSPETRRLRFLAPKPRLTAAELRYLTEVDGVDHVALVAVAEDLAGGPLIGVARFVRLSDHEAAEMAIVVADVYQRRGVGTVLARSLADCAREHGIRRFVAHLLSENQAATKLISLIAARLTTERSSTGTREVVAELAA